MSAFDRRAIPLVTFADPTNPESPWVLSYFAQRRIAGFIGIFLPIIVFLLTKGLGHALPDSISASYYTIARNYFVGSLCAVGIFLVSSIGYDEDRLLSLLAGALAIIVAFSPCKDPNGAPPVLHSNIIHGIAACLLFLDFAWICLFRFTRTTNQQSPSPGSNAVTPRKHIRNSFFRVCGVVMVATMAIYAIVDFGLHKEIPHLLFAVETICLFVFGLAWIIKGQLLLADV
jgi:hypothetical protein